MNVSFSIQHFRPFFKSSIDITCVISVPVATHGARRPLSVVRVHIAPPSPKITVAITVVAYPLASLANPVRVQKLHEKEGVSKKGS